MPEDPRYEPVPASQEHIYDDGIHVGYRVALKFKKGETVHEEAVDVVVGAAQAATLANGSSVAFTTWQFGQVEAHNLVAKANEALDAL